MSLNDAFDKFDPKNKSDLDKAKYFYEAGQRDMRNACNDIMETIQNTDCRAFEKGRFVTAKQEIRAIKVGGE